MIHTFNDASVLVKMKAKELVGIPVWKGNRFIDVAHAEHIGNAIENISTLDTTVFRVVKYKDVINGNTQKYLVDGQHRQHVLKKYYENHNILYAFANNFDVLVHEKTVDSEADAIEYFNAINNVKPQQDCDPKRMADKYIVALEKAFVKLIRFGTKRPFLSNELLRKGLEENVSMLKQSNEYVQRFITRVETWNKKKIESYQFGLIETKEHTILESCIKKGFILAFDPKLPWIKECLVF